MNPLVGSKSFLLFRSIAPWDHIDVFPRKYRLVRKTVREGSHRRYCRARDFSSHQVSELSPSQLPRIPHENYVMVRISDFVQNRSAISVHHCCFPLLRRQETASNGDEVGKRCFQIRKAHYLREVTVSWGVSLPHTSAYHSRHSRHSRLPKVCSVRWSVIQGSDPTTALSIFVGPAIGCRDPSVAWVAGGCLTLGSLI